MNESVAEYVKRIENTLGGQNPIKVQATTAQKLARLVKRATLAKLKKRPAPDKWSATEIIAHLADSEIVTGWRMRLVLGTPGTAILAFDQDRWAAAGHYSKRDPRKALEHFRVLREMNLALLESLTPEQWKHCGMHSERGEESIERMVQMMAGHDLNHLAQVEELLKAKKAAR
jgi:hypothetical protein